MNNLLYRRQFIIGDKYIEKFKGWKCLSIGNELYATIHPDLEYAQSENREIRLTLLGFLLDPYNPNLTNEEVLKNINRNISSFDDLLHETYELSGRWIIIYQDKFGVKIINDLVGLREVYYIYLNGQFWCGTDPAILKENLPIEKTTDTELLYYSNSEYFKKRENTWYGDKTIYKDVYHLLPNHVLDVTGKKVYRYWINKESNVSFEKVVEEAAKILNGSLKGANTRYNLMLGATAGLDSRLLIAASKDISDDIFYFVSKMNLKDSHMDIKTPVKLFSKLGLNLNVLTGMSPVRNEVKQVLKKNITLCRDNSRNKALQYYLDYLPDKMNVNGAVNEISRNFYGNNHPHDEDITSEYLLNLIGYNGHTKFLKKEFSIWLDEIRNIEDNTMNMSIIDLFYWEQRMGNWGTLTRNEQDLAIEGFMPYNNRKLIMLLTSVDSKYREKPDYYLHKKIIEYLWPETLNEPINPLSSSDRIIAFLSNHIPNNVKKLIKKYII